MDNFLTGFADELMKLAEAPAPKPKLVAKR